MQTQSFDYEAMLTKQFDIVLADDEPSTTSNYTAIISVSIENRDDNAPRFVNSTDATMEVDEVLI